MAVRHLVSQIREVPAAGRALYDRRWDELRSAATALGAHAWRFVSTIHPHRYLEFLEFPAETDPRADPGVAAPLQALDREVGAAEAEEWQEL